MKTLLTTLLLTASLYAYGDWVSMTKVESERIDYTWNRCTYVAVYSGFTIAINHKGICPYRIKYNPSTSYWKK